MGIDKTASHTPVGVAEVEESKRQTEGLRMTDAQADDQPSQQTDPQASDELDDQPTEKPVPPSDARVRLLPDEEIVLDLRKSAWWTLGYYITTLGLWAIWRKRHRFIVTNQRLIVVKGLINKSEGAIPLTRIQDVHLKTSPFFGGQVDLSSAGGGGLGIERIQQLTRADATTLADELNARTQLSGGSGL